MTEAAKPSDDGTPANQRRRGGPVELVHQPAPFEPGDRLESPDYGPGTVVAYVGIGWQVYWDRTLAGTVDGHILTHELTYLQLGCRRL